MKNVFIVAALAALASSSFAQRKSPDSLPEKTKVYVTSTPDGGEVYVDGKFRGNAPSYILLSAGEHVVKVVLRQKEWTRTIEITGGEIHIQADLVEERSSEQVAPTTRPGQPQVAATADTNPAKQKAVEQMRRVATAIKQCPGTIDRESSP